MAEMKDYTDSWEPWQKALAEKHGLTCPPGWYGFSCGPGWCDLLDRAFTDMKALGWSGEIHQVKEKFGTLRLYCDEDWRPDLAAIIHRAEAESTLTCEDCSHSGADVTTTSGDRYWILTLCPECRAKGTGR